MIICKLPPVVIYISFIYISFPSEQKNYSLRLAGKTVTTFPIVTAVVRLQQSVTAVQLEKTHLITEFEALPVENRGMRYQHGAF